MAHRRSILRRLFTILSVLSVLLCLQTIGLWVRSYTYCDACGYGPSGRRAWAVRSQRGQIEFCLGSFNQLRPDVLASPRRFWLEVVDANDSQIGAQEFVRFGHAFSSGSSFGFSFYSNRPLSDFWAIGIPHWFLVLVLSILPALCLRAALRSHRRHREGLCPTCGYDLRATPDRCPECGELTAHRPKAVQDAPHGASDA